MSLQAMIEARRIEQVEPNAEEAALALDEAARHATSAEGIVATDPNGAYQLAHDGARKAVMPHMRRSGFRVRSGEGSHVITAEYATVAIDQTLGPRLERMRRRRNRSEYGAAYFEADEVRDAIDVARALVAAVAG